VPAEWDRELLKRIAPHIQERMKTLKDAQELIRFVFTDDIGYETKLLIPKKSDRITTAEALARSRAVLAELEPFTGAVIQPALEHLAEQLGWSRGELNGAIRMAITGRKVGPPLYESLEVLGKEKSLRRIEKAQELLVGGPD
jgi:glutamyl-tRNA synthetase